MKYLYVIAAALALTGCASNPLDFNNTEVVVQNQYVVRTAPDQLKTLPPLPPNLPSGANDTQLATWLNNTERYVSDLEDMIQTLVNFYEAPVTAAEAGDLQPVMARSQAQPDGRVIRPQASASTFAAKPNRFTTANPTVNKKVKE